MKYIFFARLCCSLMMFLMCASAVEEVDVLVVYSEAAKEVLKKKTFPDLKTCSEHLVQRMNYTVAETKLQDVIHFNAVDSRVYNCDLRISDSMMEQKDEYLQHQQQGLSQALVQLVDDLAYYRDLAKADIVVYVADYPCRDCKVGEKGNVLGMGRGYSLLREKEYIEQGKSEGIGIAEKHYIAIIHCSSLTDKIDCNIVGHEVGHLLGCGHPDNQDDSPGPYYYCDSCGIYSAQGYKSTVMGYANRDAASSCKYQREAYFSSAYPAPSLKANRAQGESKKIEGDIFHNNAGSVLRNAPLLSHYRLSGKETLPNISYQTPIMMPPMVRNTRFLSGLLNSKHGSLEKLLATFEQSFPGISDRKNYFSTVYGTNASKVTKGGSGKKVWYELQTPVNGRCHIGVRKFGTAKYLQPQIVVYNGSGKEVGHAASDKGHNGFECVSAVPAIEGESLYIAVESALPNGGQFSLFACLEPDNFEALVDRILDYFKGGLKSVLLFAVSIVVIVMFVILMWKDLRLQKIIKRKKPN